MTDNGLPCLDLLAATPGILRGLMSELTDDDARWKPAPDRFSVTGTHDRRDTSVATDVLDNDLPVHPRVEVAPPERTQSPGRMLGLLGGFVLYAVFQPAMRVPAIALGAVSLASIVALAWSTGGAQAS